MRSIILLPIAVSMFISTQAIKINVSGDDDSYPHWMDGFGGYKTYKRDIPSRFKE